MEKILKTLTKGLDWEVREQVVRRYKMLVSQYQYMKSSQNEHLLLAIKNNWFDEKFTTIFALNSFYQIVLGPLASSTRGISEIGLGSKTPIKYGQSLSFDAERSRSINKAYASFTTLATGLGYSDWLLTSNRASDLIFSVAKETTSPLLE